MKKDIIVGATVCSIVVLLLSILYPTKIDEKDYKLLTRNTVASLNEFDTKYNNYLKMNFFNGEYKTDIANKLNRYLNSTLSGKGEFIASNSIKKGVDPYLVTAVMLEESGCMWTCSYLARVCNNYGGQKGSPSCNGGSYRKFSSQEEGLNYTIDKLAGYYNNGLTTPEQINPKYATSTSWASKINNYINKLKS